ncbi:MAG: DEAD/DEAH box helicase, partial [Minisyncoccia bacterium]
RAVAKKINELTQDDDYRKFISNLASIYINENHSVLVIADRVEFLEKVKEYVGETCLLVTGDTPTEERQLAKEQLLNKTKMCIAGSRQIFSEGISINILSCVILAVPMSNDSLLEQIIGRVMREHPGKQNPVVVDIQFSGWLDKKQNNDRLGLYLRKGWEVLTV